MAEEIWHHGIKGQRWGVRRTPEQLGHRKPKSEAHDDYKKAHDRKSVSEMSDAELRSRINRINMEEQYKKMNPNRVERGKRVFKTAFKAVSTVALVSTTAITLNNNYKTISKWFGKS